MYYFDVFLGCFLAKGSKIDEKDVSKGIFKRVSKNIKNDDFQDAAQVGK